MKYSLQMPWNNIDGLFREGKRDRPIQPFLLHWETWIFFRSSLYRSACRWIYRWTFGRKATMLVLTMTHERSMYSRGLGGTWTFFQFSLYNLVWFWSYRLTLDEKQKRWFELRPMNIVCTRRLLKFLLHSIVWDNSRYCIDGWFLFWELTRTTACKS